MWEGEMIRSEPSRWLDLYARGYLTRQELGLFAIQAAASFPVEVLVHCIPSELLEEIRVEATHLPVSFGIAPRVFATGTYVPSAQARGGPTQEESLSSHWEEQSRLRYGRFL